MVKKKRKKGTASDIQDKGHPKEAILRIKIKLG